MSASQRKSAVYPRQRRKTQPITRKNRINQMPREQVGALDNVSHRAKRGGEPRPVERREEIQGERRKPPERFSSFPLARLCLLSPRSESKCLPGTRASRRQSAVYPRQRRTKKSTIRKNRITPTPREHNSTFLRANQSAHLITQAHAQSAEAFRVQRKR